MKVILNQDVPNLGELGDVKNVANGYARNYLFPKGFAVPHNDKMVALFDKRKAEIEQHKAEKRNASAGLKTRIEAEELTIGASAGENGKLYGAITGATIADELAKKGITIDRKRIEIPSKTLKNTGKYHLTVKLYEKDEATLTLVIVNTEPKKEPKPEAKPRHESKEVQEGEAAAPAEAGAAPAEAAVAENAPAGE